VKRDEKAGLEGRQISAKDTCVHVWQPSE